MDDLLKYQIALTMMPGIGGINAKKLISYCGGIEGVFKEKEQSLLKIPGIGKHLARAVRNFNQYDRVEQEMLFIEKNKIKTFFFTDKGYPERLKHCDDGPILLFLKGNADLNSRRMIAIVGTRSISEYGKTKCDEITEGLKKYSPVIVSGLAYGVDARAHKGALQHKLQTVGVLGHGLDRIYPPLNANLAEQMVNENGGLLTDFVTQTKPDRENFPKRNRIIAGLVDALIVIEAAKTGGALITANIANSYNRDVFAVPGKTTDIYSQGCNMLIKANKAFLIDTAKDIEYIMRWEPENRKKNNAQQQLFVELDEDETIITNLLKNNGETSFDSLFNQSGFSFSKTSSILLNLEFKGIIRPLPGKMFKLEKSL